MLPARDLTEVLLDGHQPAPMTLAVLMKPLPEAWDRQRTKGFGSGMLRIE
jgi:hypothetical protein